VQALRLVGISQANESNGFVFLLVHLLPLQALLGKLMLTQREQRLLLLCFAGILIRLKIRTK
jgi:hypothetical protein